MDCPALSEHRVADQSGAFERVIWLEDEPAESGLLFLDADLYLQRVQALEVLHELRAAKKIPPVSAAFVSNQSAAARHVDLVCSDPYADFIAGDVVRWWRQQQPAPREFVIIGLSLSGLAAAHIATRCPATFRAAVCQSPSFWWEKGRFAKNFLLPAGCARNGRKSPAAITSVPRCEKRDTICSTIIMTAATIPPAGGKICARRCCGFRRRILRIR